MRRTFCFFEEIEYLIKNGLIRGGSLGECGERSAMMRC